MKYADQKAANIEQLAAQASQIETTIDPNNLFPGFGDRLNEMLDLVVPTIPPLFGRSAALAAVLGLTKATTGRWFNENRPPNAQTLRKLAMWLSTNTNRFSAAEMEIYLLYGHADKPTQSSENVDYKIYALVYSRCSELNVELGNNSIVEMAQGIEKLLKMWNITPTNADLETLHHRKLTAIDALILSFAH